MNSPYYTMELYTEQNELGKIESLFCENNLISIGLYDRCNFILIFLRIDEGWEDYGRYTSEALILSVI